MLPKYLAEAIEAEYSISPSLRSVLEDTTHSVEPVTENDLIPEEEEETHKDSESMRTMILILVVVRMRVSITQVLFLLLGECDCGSTGRIRCVMNML